MISNRFCGGTSKGRARLAPGFRLLLVPGLGALLLSSACTRKPEVAATAPPPAAFGSRVQQTGEQMPGQSGLAPLSAEPGTTSRAEGPSPGVPETAPGTGQLAAKPGPGEEGATRGTGPERSTPLPPGTEAILSPPSPPREEPLAKVAQVAAKESPLKDILFDFDKAEIRPDAKSPLDEDIRWLRAHPQAAITIEGHCDERGSSEYNLGLGERRAKATKDYLVASGIDGKQIATVSYGKERPFVLGHDESAWKWNRRAHFVVTKE